MDNQDYLNQIAAKPTPNSKRFFSPFIIKIIIAAVAALALIITLGGVMSSINNHTTALYQSFYLRLHNLSSDTGPIATFSRYIKSSELRALAGTLKSSLNASSQNFTSVLAEMEISTTEINPDAAASDAAVIAEYTQTLQDARLNGLLDRTFANSTTLQISLLLAIGSEILERNPTDNARVVVDQIMSGLEILHTRFANYNNNSS
ncbi:hypothetical protein FWF89_02460 [Candidatus Saccharibacteria bacterium]|nr:hypothetical protein [Candidatus Saccharibacteria bacterium]